LSVVHLIAKPKSNLIQMMLKIAMLWGNLIVPPICLRGGAYPDERGGILQAI